MYSWFTFFKLPSQRRMFSIFSWKLKLVWILLDIYLGFFRNWHWCYLEDPIVELSSFGSHCKTASFLIAAYTLYKIVHEIQIHQWQDNSRGDLGRYKISKLAKRYFKGGGQVKKLVRILQKYSSFQCLTELPIWALWGLALMQKYALCVLVA